MDFKAKYLLGLIPVIIVLGVLYYFGNIVTYVVLAWALSMVGAPIVKFFRKFLGKNLAAALTLGLFVIFTGLLAWLIIPSLMQQARNLSNIDYNSAISSLEEPIKDWEQMLQNRGLISTEELVLTENEDQQEQETKIESKMVYIDSLMPGITFDSSKVALVINIIPPEIKAEKDVITDKPASFVESVKSNLIEFIDPARIQSVISGFIGFLGNILIAFFSIMFIAFFFLKEQGLFFNMVSSIVPNKFEKQTESAIDQSSALLVRYFIGIFFQIMIITTLVYILLSLFGIKNALLIGFFAALMNVIPYVGPLLGASFGVLITISSNINVSFYDILLPDLLKVVLVFAIMQMVDNFLIQPFIFGRSVKAHPLEIFLVILIGGQLGGIMGMVLAIPIYTVVRVLAKVFLSEFKIVQRITSSI